MAFSRAAPDLSLGGGPGRVAGFTGLLDAYPQNPKVPYRFVIYQPDASRVEISGSFSGWKSIPLKKVGTQGYWETVQEVPPGEYRLCYIIEGGRRIPDPTILAREKDDFGGENSILEVRDRS